MPLRRKHALGEFNFPFRTDNGDAWRFGVVTRQTHGNFDTKAARVGLGKLHLAMLPHRSHNPHVLNNLIAVLYVYGLHGGVLSAL